MEFWRGQRGFVYSNLAYSSMSRFAPVAAPNLEKTGILSVKTHSAELTGTKSWPMCGYAPS